MDCGIRPARTTVLFTALTLLALGCEPGEIADIDLSDGASAPWGITGDYEETGYEEWQGAVGLKIGSWRCSATLIHPRVVVTAGHCVWDQVSSPGTIVVFGGADKTSFQDFAAGEEVVVHPGYNDGVVNAANVDIALVKLDSDVTQVDPYPVRQDSPPEVGDRGVLVGYGYIAHADTGSWGVHRAGETEVLDVVSRCLELGGEAGFCRGDSGGPFFTMQKEQWVLSGVASWTLYTNACYAAYGNYVVNVVDTREWIAETHEYLTGEALPDVEEIDTDSDTADGGDLGADDGGDDDCGCRHVGSPPRSSLLRLLLPHLH